MDKSFDNLGGTPFLMVKSGIGPLFYMKKKNLNCQLLFNVQLLPEGVDQSSFHGDSPYEIMFGPDICGPSNRRAHAILSYKGNNLLIKEDVKCEKDKLTHLYTLVIKSDNTFKIMIDQKTVKSGSLYDNWDFLPPKTIRDPEAKKPADWVDEATIPDPEDKKPEDWDDVPEKIPDPTAEKPQDWNEEEDGEWEVGRISVLCCFS